MPVKWKSGRFPGVRFYEHESRKHGVMPDRYFAIRFQSQGKRREEGLGWASQGWTEKKAADELAKLREAARKGEGPASLAEKRQIASKKRKAQEADRKKRELEGLTFGEFWRETYFPQCKRDKTTRTWKREASFFKKWLDEQLAGTPLKDTSPIQLERIKSKMTKAGNSPRSISYCLDVVRQVFHKARTLGLHEGPPPTASVKKPKSDNKRLRFLSQEEASALLEALQKRNPTLHAMALLSLQCGLRAGEIFALRWADVDLDRSLLTLRDTKNTKTRPAYLTKPARGVLESLAMSKSHDLVFPSRYGEKRKVISNTFPKTVKDLGFNEGVTDRRDKVVFHSLRHTFASWLVMGGTPLYTVGKLLGHSTSAMTERYSHLAPDHMKEAVKVLENALAPARHKGKANVEKS